MAKKPPRDPNQLGKYILDVTTGEVQKPEKDPAAVALGRKGGLKGGKARADSLTPERRSEIAREAAKERWKKED